MQGGMLMKGKPSGRYVYASLSMCLRVSLHPVSACRIVLCSVFKACSVTALLLFGNLFDFRDAHGCGVFIFFDPYLIFRFITPIAKVQIWVSEIVL